MGTGDLEREAHFGNSVAHPPNAVSAQLIDQVSGQPAGYSASVGPLPSPTGDQVFCIGFFVED
jgi:hypothetical protein